MKEAFFTVLLFAVGVSVFMTGVERLVALSEVTLGTAWFAASHIFCGLLAASLPLIYGNARAAASLKE